MRREERLRRLAGKPLNVDLSRRGDFTPENGWRIDDVRTRLPAGSFEAAKRIARDYDFAEPSIVRATFDRDTALEERNMLLELRFLGLRIYAGVRVGDVYDEERELDGRPGHVWGWNYRTLKGHVEQGQMDWQVWCFPEPGEVLFRISAFSKPARDGNPILALGFRLFGRREQLKFLHRTSERMAHLAARATSG
jgi:uncharacterized protein (UPF0548 family)